MLLSGRGRQFQASGPDTENELLMTLKTMHCASGFVVNCEKQRNVLLNFISGHYKGFKLKSIFSNDNPIWPALVAQW